MSVTDDPLAYDGAVKTAPPEREIVDNRSLAARIFDADDVSIVTLPVPEWGITLELRSPNGAERADLQNAFVDMEASQRSGEVVMRDLKAMFPALIIACAYDPSTGERVFDATPETVAALNRKNGSVLDRIATACLPLAGLTSEDVEEKKEGSSTTPSSGNASL